VAKARGTTIERVHSPELEVDEHEGTTHTDEGDDRDQSRQQPVFDERFELVDVGGHPGHDPSGHLALVVVQRETLHLGPDADAQRQHDPFRRPAGHEGLAHLVDQIGQGDDQKDSRRHEEHGHRPFDTPLSMPVLTRIGSGQAGQASMTTRTKPTRSGRRNWLRSRQVEAPVVARLFLEVDRGDVAHRR
jgi:hypothetical protein